MPRRGNKTLAISTEWVIEVFTWPTDWPLPDRTSFAVGSVLPKPAPSFLDTPVLGFNVGDKVNKDTPPKFVYADKSVITSYSGLQSLEWDSTPTGHRSTSTPGKQVLKPSAGVADLQKVLEKSDKTPGDNLSIGLKTMSLRRSKGSIDSQCAMSVVGPLPKHTRQGNWVIVSSIEHRKKYVNGKAVESVHVLPRFIGQIQTITSTYSVQGNGNITEVSNIQVKEWSTFLLSPVRYDLRSTAEYLNPVSNFLASAGMAVSALTNPKDEPRFDEILRNVTMSFNPYQMSKMFLFVIGGLNATQSPLGSNVSPDKFTIGVTMPDVPKSVLNRMNLSNTNPKGAFQNDFALMIAGRQLNSIYNDGDWDGQFNDIKTELIDNISDFAGDVTGQPVGLGTGVLSQLGKASVWSLISEYTDPSMNEAFTDILYQKPQSGSYLIFRPAIFVRGKPYKTVVVDDLMETSGILDDSIRDMYDTWTYYEDLPRIRIDDTLILGAEFSSTIASSPNYVYADYHGMDGISQATYNQQWGTLFRKKLNPEMERFGGNIFPVKTQYYHCPGQELMWAKTRIALGVAWQSYLYRMASGTLQIKDSSIPLTVGFNMQFDFGDYEIVAQIESISVNFHISESGVKETTTSIAFSRAMMVTETGDLDFLPQGFGDLFKAGE